MRQLLTGNEAIARGAWEAGVLFASAYPGAPSTEILENLANYTEIQAEWAPNEKVAMEAAIGASIAGARSVASMKHVGVNLAADPLLTFSHMGVNGGMLLVSADEPGQYSSQNEQDNRHYARMAKIPMLEPADSQECRDMARVAFDISEEFDAPVLLRSTTRVCHTKSAVACGERGDSEVNPYRKDIHKYMPLPTIARQMRVRVEERTEKLRQYSENSPLNRAEWHGNKIGVITSGVCYCHAREVFGDSVSYLKLGFTWPLPQERIRSFCIQVDAIYVIEENDSYLEEAVQMLGFGSKIQQKGQVPRYGELTPEILRGIFLEEEQLTAAAGDRKGILRPPTLCAGCPHRGIFYEVGKRENIVVAGDISCYTLGYADPYGAVDFKICTGSSFSAGHGMQKMLDQIPGNSKRVVAIMGDATFFHSGMNSLLDVVYNCSRVVCVILDNTVTGGTDRQDHSGSGKNKKGEIAATISIEGVARALGVRQIRTINPKKLNKVRDTLDWALALEEPSVIIIQWPCSLKRLSIGERERYAKLNNIRYEVDKNVCSSCKYCLGSVCPALCFDAELDRAVIDPVQCVGCGVCSQLCPDGAIRKREEDASANGSGRKT